MGERLISSAATPTWEGTPWWTEAASGCFQRCVFCEWPGSSSHCWLLHVCYRPLKPKLRRDHQQSKQNHLSGVELTLIQHVMIDQHWLKLWNKRFSLSAVSHFCYCLETPTEALWVTRIWFNLTSEVTESISQNQYYFIHFRLQLY